MDPVSQQEVDPNFTFVITLERDKNYEFELYQLESGWAVRFELGTSLWGCHVRLFTTHPLNDPPSKEVIDGTTWYEATLLNGSVNKNDAFCCYADVVCHKSGPHRFAFINGSDTISTTKGRGFFQVLPVIKSGTCGLNFRLQAFQCQTMLSKLLGPLDEWEDRLRVASESGFNMIHLTPIQALGISNSAYSIADQLKLNPAFVSPGIRDGFSEVQKLTEKMLSKHETLVICDVVWNHTAKNSPWLLEHPECGYNLVNSPYLRPAFVLDRLLYHFSRAVEAGKYADRGLTVGRWDHAKLGVLKHTLLSEVLPAGNLQELFQVNVDRMVEQFNKLLTASSGPYKDDPSAGECPRLKIIQDEKYHRLSSTVDMQLAMRLFNRKIEGCANEKDRQAQCRERFRQALVDLNNEATRICWENLHSAVNALLGHVSYERVEERGPKLADFTEHHPLLPQYFYCERESSNWQSDEEFMHTPDAKHVLAHNGWVMNDNPLKNFAEYPSKVYFRRELVCWGDSVKLRYGNSPSDCPYLWDRMVKYSQQSARMFYGFRLDNCHSTPIHVAEYLLKEARLVRPELFVVAELFTQSESVDNLFVNRLGINALIREAMVAPDPHEQGRLVWRFGGLPVGSFYPCPFRPLMPAIALAMFFDLTHDNPSAIQTRTVYDILPTAAMVSSAGCATGSNRGYDELVPYHVHVVNEKRLYTSWTDEEELTRPDQVNRHTGIIKARNALCRMHAHMCVYNYSEIYVDQKTEDVTVIRRYCPTLMQSVIFIIRNCFDEQSLGRQVHMLCVELAGVLETVLFECKLEAAGAEQALKRTYSKGAYENASKQYILGLDGYELDMKENIKPVQSDFIFLEDGLKSSLTAVEFKDLPPSSVVALSVALKKPCKVAIDTLHKELTQINLYMADVIPHSELKNYVFVAPDLRPILDRMTLLDMNYVLFRSLPEELSDDPSAGAYNVPNFGSFVYNGLQGIFYHISIIRRNNDLGHPICDNLRQGDWLADYIVQRILRNPRTKELGDWLKVIFSIYKSVPDFLKPCYFELIIGSVYSLLCDAILNKMSKFVQLGSVFLRSMAVASVALCGSVKSAPLPFLSTNLKFATREMFSMYVQERCCTTISAGLPHFAEGLFRNWGRDTFIALRGLMLVTGRYDEARCIILAYAGAMRHGLIPNLLGEGTHARYNCRDAVWWWLLSIKAYCEMAPNGISILNDPVNRLYADDTSDAYVRRSEQPLQETMQEALSTHFNGLSFRERNAGHQIDEHMRSEGFDVMIGVDLETGFVYGGNSLNCGTWMDKMGSSDKAGNRGVPATPRDGSAVELTAICYCIVSWLSKLYANRTYLCAGVSKDIDSSIITWQWSEWKAKIAESFEERFWIPVETSEVNPSFSDPSLINVRGIYKDTYRASHRWADYQLRPNFPIAIALAPELFDVSHAVIALDQVKAELLGPLGMKTLTPRDLNYVANYDNSDDSTDYKRAKGFNYHQGPEWLWPVGYYLRAKLAIARIRRASNANAWKEVVSEVQHFMGSSWTHLRNSPWFSLPELTNDRGSYCRDSCEAQAWTIGCLLEVFYDLDAFEKLP